MGIQFSFGSQQELIVENKNNLHKKTNWKLQVCSKETEPDTA